MPGVVTLLHIADILAKSAQFIGYLLLCFFVDDTLVLKFIVKLFFHG